MDANNPSERACEASRQAGESPAGVIQIDPAASAALAEAIKSAKQGLKPSGASAEPKNAPVNAPVTAGRRPSYGKVMVQATAALLLIGAGWSASYVGTLSNADALRALETETARSQEILTRLGSDLDALRETVAAYKDVEHTSSTLSASSQSRIADGQNKLADKVERLTVALQEPAQRLTSLEDRISRMEGEITTTLAGLNAKPAPLPPAAPASAPAPSATEAAVRDEAPAAKPTKAEPIDGWVLREVYDGAALVEARNGRLYEVAPGGMLPGVGRIGSIERRGTRWVVLTDKGFISTYR